MTDDIVCRALNGLFQRNRIAICDLHQKFADVVEFRQRCETFDAELHRLESEQQEARNNLDALRQQAIEVSNRCSPTVPEWVEGEPRG